MKASLLIFLGGGLGSVLRYWISFFIKSNCTTSSFPWATFSVNIIGSLLIGFLTTLVLKNTLNPELRLFTIIGICGGFTTFSTFTNETILLLKNGSYLISLSYIISSVGLGVLAVILGCVLANLAIR